MNSAELTEWTAFMELEGLPEMNAEIRASRALQHFVNAYRDTEQHKHPYELTEFLPPWILEDAPKVDEDDEDPTGIDPAVTKLVAEKMNSLRGVFG